MTAGVEAPIQAPVLQLEDGRAELLDGLIAEISQWTVLDAHLWPFDRDHGPKSSSGEVVRTPNPPPIRLPTGLTDTHDRSPAICDVVAAWRTAERDLAGLVENEPEWNHVRAEIISLRALHHGLFEARLGSRPGKIG